MRNASCPRTYAPAPVDRAHAAPPARVGESVDRYLPPVPALPPPTGRSRLPWPTSPAGTHPATAGYGSYSPHGPIGPRSHRSTSSRTAAGLALHAAAAVVPDVSVAGAWAAAAPA